MQCVTNEVSTCAHVTGLLLSFLPGKVIYLNFFWKVSSSTLSLRLDQYWQFGLGYRLTLILISNSLQVRENWLNSEAQCSFSLPTGSTMNNRVCRTLNALHCAQCFAKNHKRKYYQYYTPLLSLADLCIFKKLHPTSYTSF